MVDILDEDSKENKIFVAVLVTGIIMFILIGAFVLYIDPFPRPPTGHYKEVLRLNVEDAPTSSALALSGNDSRFEPGEPLFIITQTGGDSIEWSEYRIYAELFDEGFSFLCEIIPDQEMSGGTTTETGQSIQVHYPGEDYYFKPGDRLEVSITKGDEKVFRTGDPVILE